MYFTIVCCKLFSGVKCVKFTNSEGFTIGDLLPTTHTANLPISFPQFKGPRLVLLPDQRAMADEEQTGPQLAVVIKPTAGGDKFAVHVSTSATVAELKAQVASAGPSIPAEEQRLIYKGQVLKDERALSDYGMRFTTSVNGPRSTTCVFRVPERACCALGPRSFCQQVCMPAR